MSVAQMSRDRVRTINVASDFSRSPGGRSRRNGPHNGVEFRTEVLEPLLRKIPNEYTKLVVNLDGVDTYIGSFLEEAFGGLLRGFYDTFDEASAHLEIQASGEFEVFRDLAYQYMREQEDRNLRQR